LKNTGGEIVEDTKIIELYFSRDERAIEETAKKYGRYCHTIANNILNSDPDAEECVNDTYLSAWNSIPPTKPNRLASFLGRIVRNLALNRYAFENAEKRRDGTLVLLEEIAEILADPDGEDGGGESEIMTHINAFLATLDSESRKMFVRRYWYMSPVKDIARDLGATESRVKVTLMRTRNKLKKYLEEMGVNL
jgi:RNA polymerase sigma-70 factor (ECF subfamily)